MTIFKRRNVKFDRVLILEEQEPAQIGMREIATRAITNASLLMVSTLEQARYELKRDNRFTLTLIEPGLPPGARPAPGRHDRSKVLNTIVRHCAAGSYHVVVTAMHCAEEGEAFLALGCNIYCSKRGFSRERFAEILDLRERRSTRIYADDPPSDPVTTYSILSPRQREIWELTQRGHSASVIAGILGIDRDSVRVHRCQARRKIRQNLPFLPA